MSWEKVRLGDVTDLCLGKMLDQEKNKGDYHPYLANVNVRWGSFDLENLPQMRFEDDEQERYGLKYGDLIICEGGEPGRCAIWKDVIPNMKIQKALHRVRVHECLDYRYLFYWFVWAGKRGALEQYFTGATIKHMPGQKLKSVIIDKPPIETQRRIADILSDYDDLIENNRKQTKLLEEAAQRLYQEWFVDLHFPGHEHTKIVDGVPEGWEPATLDDICFVRKETLPPSKIDAGVPYIGLEHMPRKDICLSEWGDSSEINSSKFRYYEDDILFGKIRPYFHKVGFALNSGVASTDAIILRNVKGLWSLLLMTVSSSEFVNYTYQNCKEGAKMPRADWKQMKSYPIMIADSMIQNTFENQIYTITRKIKCLALQMKGLSEARDRLLPKLMS